MSEDQTQEGDANCRPESFRVHEGKVEERDPTDGPGAIKMPRPPALKWPTLPYMPEKGNATRTMFCHQRVSEPLLLFPDLPRLKKEDRGLTRAATAWAIRTGK